MSKLRVLSRYIDLLMVIRKDYDLSVKYGPDRHPLIVCENPPFRIGWYENTQEFIIASHDIIHCTTIEDVVSELKNLDSEGEQFCLKL